MAADRFKEEIVHRGRLMQTEPKNGPLDSDHPSSETDARVVFDYIKSPSFRSIHVDGFIGGMTPSGHLQLAFYSERIALPQRHVHLVDENGALGKQLEDETLSRAGIVREIDVNAFLTLEAARNTRDWLNQQVEMLEERHRLLEAMVDSDAV